MLSKDEHCDLQVVSKIKIFETHSRRSGLHFVRFLEGVQGKVTMETFLNKLVKNLLRPLRPWL